jgi:hypothetical protein
VLPFPGEPADAVGSLLWLLVIIAASFLVSWLFATRWRVPRNPYIAILGVMTIGLTAGYLLWIGLAIGDVLTTGWVVGLVAGAAAGAITALAMTRMPSTLHRHGADEGIAFAWEGLVYGVTEGVLLSALPALIAWQMVHSLRWSGAAGDAGLWVVALLASVAVIVAHHLGYWEYRNRSLVPIVIACGLLTVAFLLSGSVLAPVVGHVIMHSAAIAHGTELPPHPREGLPTPSSGLAHAARR